MSQPLSAESVVFHDTRRTRTDSSLFVGMAAVLMAIVLVGFAPTFFLRGLFDVPAQRTPYV
jgi:hypothetical protein